MGERSTQSGSQLPCPDNGGLGLYLKPLPSPLMYVQVITMASSSTESYPASLSKQAIRPVQGPVETAFMGSRFKTKLMGD